MVLTLEDTLQKLRAYQDVSYPILSVYLDTYHKDHPDMLRSFRQLIVDTLTEDDQESVKRNISYMSGFLSTFPTPQTCRTLALFSGGDHLWEVITTEFSIHPQLTISHSPFIKPIEDELTEHTTYVVVLADREKAFLVRFKEGNLQMKKEIYAKNDSEKVPQRIKGRHLSMRSGKIDRHIQGHLHRHLQHIGKEVDHFVSGHEIAGVLIGSHKQLITPLEHHLSKKVQDIILGEFIADLNAPFNEVMMKSQKELLSRELYHHYPSPTLSR